MTAIVILKVAGAFTCCSSTDSLCLADVDRQVVLLISRYRKCARLYWRNTHKEPSLWDDTAYQMFKVCRPRCKPLLGNLIARPPSNRIGRHWLSLPRPFTPICPVTVVVDLQPATVGALVRRRLSYGSAWSTEFEFLSVPLRFTQLHCCCKTWSLTWVRCSFLSEHRLKSF